MKTETLSMKTLTRALKKISSWEIIPKTGKRVLFIGGPLHYVKADYDRHGVLLPGFPEIKSESDAELVYERLSGITSNDGRQVYILVTPETKDWTGHAEKKIKKAILDRLSSEDLIPKS